MTYTDGEAKLIRSARQTQADRATDLIEHFGLFGEHPEFPVPEWKKEVRADSTRMGYWEWVANFGPSAMLHSCDICDGTFTLEEMASLGGDMYFAGGLRAFPAECQGCSERR